jgi:hypothetical protein
VYLAITCALLYVNSSGQRRRLGHITKQGNSLLRFLLVEAAQVTVRSDAVFTVANSQQVFNAALSARLLQMVRP